MYNFKTKNIVVLIICLICTVVLSSCGFSSDYLSEKYTGDKNDTGNSTVKIGYSGQLNETPLFAAYENGYFENNGIHVQLIKINDKNIKDEYDSQRLDAVTADYRFLQYIEEGLPVRFTAGLNAGCIRIIVPNKSNITKISQLEGISMGIEDFGDGTMVLSSILLNGNGINTESGISWKPYGEIGYIKAFENGDIDAACIWEPSEKDSLEINNSYRTIYTNVKTGSAGGSGHNHGSGLHFTRTFTGISASLVGEHPEKAIFITKAWLQGASWVAENNAAAVKLVIDKKYLSGSYDESLNTLSSYMWTIGVTSAKPNIKFLVNEQKNFGLLKTSVDETEFFNKVFAGIMPEFY